MATLSHRLDEFETQNYPVPYQQVELICQDHVGTYLIPFPCHWADDQWWNTRTNQALEVDILGWRIKRSRHQIQA